ncbi:MAG: LysR family transcriptional regulator [Pseudomonadota bacterium]|nr:LysR family transcriptional regulator [Pseudomonadota bacterium]
MIDKLEMFIALAQHSHFGRAAEACGVTQPTLSAAIRQLEEQLGVMLVWRGSRFQGLTPEGQRVLEWARQICGDARAMREEMRARKSGLSGHVRLGVVPTAVSMVRLLTVPFAERHPGVKFTILSRTSAEILSLLEDHRIDAGLSYLENEPLGRVVTVPLYEERYVLMVPEGHPLAVRGHADWADVGGEALAALTPDMQNRRILNQLLLAAGAAPEIAVESNSVLALVAQVRAGGCVTILPEGNAEMFAMEGLACLPLAGGGQPLGLIAPEREPYTPVLAALIDEARRVAAP